MNNNNNRIYNNINNDILLNKRIENNNQIVLNTILSCETGNLLLLREIIKSNSVDLLSCIGMNGYTLLHYASSRGHLQIVVELLKLSFPVNKINSSGETSLHLAVYNGYLLIVEVLLDYGADINAVNQFNETPLIYAARRSMPAIVRLLLQRNADITIKDCYDEDAKDHANGINTLKAFEISPLVNCRGINIPFTVIQHIFSYLRAPEVSKAALVCSKWHRAAETEGIWQNLGVRRWECALHATLGFEIAPALAFRPSKKALSR